MRIYKYILVLVVAMSTMTSCNYLDKEPDTELTLDMVFDDKVRMEGWLAYVYSGLPDPLWGYTNKYGCAALADDLRPSYLWYQWSWDCNQRAIGMWATNTSWNGDVWANMPRKIREDKIFMENVHTIDSDNVYQSDVDNMKLECRALIAYYYWWFLYWYGPCPFDPESPSVPSSTPIDELKYGQEPWDTVVDWLDNELKTVGDLLPVEYSEGDKFGRINRFFCYCTRARMLLFNASPLVNGNPMYYDHVNYTGEKLFPQSYDANKWQRALEANKAVIDLAEEYGYELFKAYNDDGTIDPFMSLLGGATTPFNPQGGNNREVLFARPSVSYTTWVAYNTPYGYKGNGGMSVSQSLVDAFALSNGIYPFDPLAGEYEGDYYQKDANGYKTIPVINPDATQAGYSETAFATDPVYRKTKWSGSQDVRDDGTAMITDANTYMMYVNREPRFYLTTKYNEMWFVPGKRKCCFYNSAYLDAGQTFEDLVGHTSNDNNGTHDAPNNGYLGNKAVKPGDDNLNGSFVYQQGKFYGLAEFYLNYVECLNQVEPGNSDILKYLNLIRERAGVPKYTWGAAGEDEIQVPSDQESMDRLIKRERRVELCVDDSNIRWSDLRRWMMMEEVCDGQDYYHGGMNFNGTKRSTDKNDPRAFYVRTANGLPRVWKEEYYWMPIFQTEIDKNENLVQLPFWEDAATDDGE